MAEAPRHRNRRHAAFSLVEMLIVIAVIIILLSLLIVGLNVATRTAQTSNTRSLMQSLKQALVRFQDDVGYLPPVLDTRRVMRESPDPGVFGGTQYQGAIQDWSSVTSLAEYLIGYDTNNRDGYGSTALGEVPFTGIRHPGPGGAWGAGPDGQVVTRNPVTQGAVLGPYLELDNDRLIASVRDAPGGGVTVHFPGDLDYDADAPKAICDYWGEPITYFRRPYLPGAIGQSYRAIDYDGDGAPDPVPTLSDIYVLRPYRLAPGAGVNARFADLDGDITTSTQLQAAEFGLMSKGPDRAVERGRRVDPDEFNRDNIVEVGP